MSEKAWIWNPKVKGSGIIECIPQAGKCPIGCPDCFFQSGRSYLEPLAENLPHIPTYEMAAGRVVRMNDGNDSNVERELVESTAAQFKDVFFNTSVPKDLEKFPGPVVLTVNPGSITDLSFHKLETAPTNLMFVRVRTNTWNLKDVVLPAADWYAVNLKVPVVLTLMAYYTQNVHEGHEDFYEWRTRTINPYWVIKRGQIEAIWSSMLSHVDNVYLCGRNGSSTCSKCGNCLREYYATKERLRASR